MTSRTNQHGGQRRVRIVAVAMLVIAGLVLVRAFTSERGSIPTPDVFAALSLDDAIEHSRSGNGPAMVVAFATADWCPPCRHMKAEVWPHPDVEAWVEQHAAVIAVDVDVERDLAERLGVRAMPTLVVFRNGEEIGRREGGLPPDQLIQWLDGLRNH